VTDLPYLDLVVIFDDGRRLECHADQRDQRRALVALGTSDPSLDQIGFARAVAWAYLSRTGAIDGTGWAEFDDTVPFVTAKEVQTAADPTRRAPSER
jgi:hypothetical protein